MKIRIENKDINSVDNTTEKEGGSMEQNESGNFREFASEQKKNNNSSQQVSTKLRQVNETENHEPLRVHKIHIHSFWLSVQSPYFRALLHSSGMKETSDEQVHLKILESEEKAHLHLLEAMYDGNILSDKTVDELLGILELADKYDVKFVFKLCKYILRKNVTTFEIGTKIMDVIKVKHNTDNVEDLTETVQLTLTEAFIPLDEHWQSEEFINLSKPSLKYLLSSDDLIVVSENTVFHALMYWMEQNSLEETNDLLDVVRFKSMTIDYLCNVVKNHPIASKMPQFNELFLGGMIYHAMPSKQKEILVEQPVSRKKSERVATQYSCVVQKKDYETALETGTYKSPNNFWACGYKISVGLIRIYNSSNLSMRIYPQLIVENLNRESLVRLKFLFRKSTTGNSSSGGFKEAVFMSESRSQPYSLEISSSDFNSNQTRSFIVQVELLE